MRVLFAVLALCSAGRLKAIYQNADGSGYKLGVLDPSNGAFSSGPLLFPPSNCTPGWQLLAPASPATTTVLYPNTTMFLLAREVCGARDTQLALFTALYYDSARAYKLASLDPNVFGSDPHIAWDYTCNVIVGASLVNRSEGALSVAYPFAQVSAYDGQVRPLPDQGLAVAYCGECWRRVENAFMSVDGRWGAQGGASEGVEQCDGCLSYVLEEYVADYQAVLPRQIVGRDLHTGSVVVNVTDPTNLLALTFLPAYAFPALTQGIYLGIGVCCELEWCAQECEGHGGKLALVGWANRAYWPSVLAILNEKPAADHSEATLGVAVDYLFEVEIGQYAARLSVWAGNKIYSFTLSPGGPNGYPPPKLTPLETSPVLDARPVAWFYTSN